MPQRKLQQLACQTADELLGLSRKEVEAALDQIRQDRTDGLYELILVELEARHGRRHRTEDDTD